MVMVNWGEIPIDIAEEIARHLDFDEDCISFSQVCSLWRSAWKKTSNHYKIKSRQPPWLMLDDAHDSPYRRYYSLVNGMIRKVDLPHAVVLCNDDDHDNYKHRRYYSSRGWLISVTRENRTITLFNPFTGKVIKLPSFPFNLYEIAMVEKWNGDWILANVCTKFIVSKSASNNSNDDDLEVCMINQGNKRLAFWKYGEGTWTMKTNVNFVISDICFCRGEIYTVNMHQVFALGIGKDNRPPRMVVDDLKNKVNLFEFDDHHNKWSCLSLYLLEWVHEGVTTLLVIFRGLFVDTKHRTSWFRVYELNVDTSELKQIKNLRNKAIFVGFNSTFFVEATPPDERGCKPNCIYFTDDNEVTYSAFPGGSDMGVYSLEEEKFIDAFLYQGLSHSRMCKIPPIWVENNVLAHLV